MMSGLEERMAKVESSLEQISKRLNHMETNMAAIRKGVERIPAVEEGIKALNVRIEDLKDSFRTGLTILAIIVSIASILMPILIRIVP